MGLNLQEIIDALNGLTPAQQAEALADADKAIGPARWVPNPGPQTEAFHCDADELFYGGQAGGGKMTCNQALTLTPTGWRTIGSLKVGDKLCATDGTIQDVIGVYPQGVKALYRVTMRDGGSLLAGLEHNWLAWRTHANRKAANKIISGPASARKWTTAQMLAEMDKGRREDGRQRAFAIPVTAPVKFNVAGTLKGRGNFIKRTIPPYLLGLLLGDGHMTAAAIGITSMDAEIADYTREVSGGEVTRHDKPAGVSKASGYLFRGGFAKGLRASLEDMNLIGTHSSTKFIPRMYLFAGIEERWELLRGLMDTDGWVEPQRACYYCTVSERLAEDVRHLAQSLGAVVTTTTKIPTYTYKGETLKGQLAYTLTIKLPDPARAFGLTRKREIAAGLKHQSEGRIIESIEYERDGEATCIMVSNANSLYITDDFIVTHNSDLAIGLALTEHTRSLILRRTNKESYGLVERMAEIVGDRDGWSGQHGVWRLDDRLIEVGGCQILEDRQKYKGVPHDLICFDELSDFLEAQYTFIIGWNRSAKPGQRCRVVCTGNPPTTPEGVWVARRWAAWLDPTHPNPADPGELRFYTTGEDGKEIEVAGRGPHMIGGELIEARSRTFIPAKLQDNPDLTRDGTYASTLAALPIELRAAYRDGRFDLSLRDQAYQAIPTAWVKEAQERWRKQPPADIPMCCIGVDVAQGGTDSTVLAIRHGGWYAPLKETPGVQTPDGQSVAGLVVQSRRDGATVTIDMGGGYGASALEHLKNNGIQVYAYKGSEGTEKRDKSHTLGFSNTRSAAYWAFREALDPSNQGGSEIALPPDSLLVSDLTCPTFRTSGGKISIMTKEDVTKKLGRSPDRGDAVIMAWWKGLKQSYVQGGFGEYNRQRTPQVVMGHSASRKR